MLVGKQKVKSSRFVFRAVIANPQSMDLQFVVHRVDALFMDLQFMVYRVDALFMDLQLFLVHAPEVQGLHADHHGHHWLSSTGRFAFRAAIATQRLR